MPQYDILFVLCKSGATTQDRLARAVGIDRASCGFVVGNLEQKKLVERAVLKSDKRKRVINATDKGRTVFLLAEPGADAAKERLFSNLNSNEREQLMSLLLKILDPDSSAQSKIPFEPL